MEGRFIPRPPPPIDVITDDGAHEEEEVDEILDSKYIRRKLHYYIAGKGQQPVDNT